MLLQGLLLLQEVPLLQAALRREPPWCLDLALVSRTRGGAWRDR